jgi:hypothetical protein
MIPKASLEEGMLKKSLVAGTTIITGFIRAVESLMFRRRGSFTNRQRFFFHRNTAAFRNAAFLQALL